MATGGTRRGIAVSTLAEARFFADGGLLLDRPEALASLRQRPLGHGKRWLVWLKLDCGNGRGGDRDGGPQGRGSYGLGKVGWVSVS